jgi:hypothetical protein
VLQSTAPLQLKRFKVGSKKCDSGIRPSVADPEKTVLQYRPIH